ncbi:MAG: hypothetical protein FWD26_00435 [Treponema sp.]|nr:hypothetical protein [Treponema sp.]
MTINLEKLRSPQFIFIIYVLVSSLLIMIFRFIFPGTEAPLLIYSRSWRLIQGVLEVFNLFPALAFSALVIPFGLAAFEENYQSFSEVFFKRLMVSVITAICAAVVYGIIFFFAMPMVKNQEENYRFSGELYQLARKNVYEKIDAGEWQDAAQFLKICDRIWHNNKDLADAKDKIAINLEERYFEETEERARARAALLRSGRHSQPQYIQTGFALSEDQEIDATEAITMSRIAFNDKRYYEAHWLANLGARLAPEGSAQQAGAARLASESWNMIASQAPNRREERLHELHNMKIAGYQAMNAQKWIEAFYIFQELITLTPDDPDVTKFLAASEQGAIKTAFFIDEIDLTLGEIINGALFSLPAGNGRTVMRFSTLTASEDVAYGMGLEFMRFDALNRLNENIRANYAKIIPFTVNEKHQLLILTHALDRNNEEKGVRGEWLTGRENAGGILLDISYEDFLLISHVRRGLPNLQVNELLNASRKLETAGYISQIFQAEILNRLGAALFFLPMAVFVIIVAWRYRAKTKPRYLFILLLPILPIIFHGFVFLYRAVFNTLGIWLILSFGFLPALIIFIVTIALLLFVSLISLSAQHG